MPKKMDISPTRGNQLRLQDQLEEFKKGHDLLDRKRQVLMRELFNRIEEAESVEKEAKKRFKEAHEAIYEARMAIGVDRLRWISLSPSADITVKIKNKSIMGVIAAMVDVQIEPLPIPYGPGDTHASLDNAHQKWLDIVKLLGKLAETTVTVWRLAKDLRRTQRQVNALEEVLIPRYKATIEEIEDSLEEKEREEIIYTKKVKQLHQSKSEKT